MQTEDRQIFNRRNLISALSMFFESEFGFE